LHSFARILHHAGTARRSASHHDRGADRPASPPIPRLGICLGAFHPVALGRAPRLLRPEPDRLEENCLIPRSANRRRISRWTMALRIHTGLVFVFLMLPLLIVFPISFSSSSYLRFPPPGLSLRWYRAYLNDPVWIDATLRSIKIALFTTALATLLGTLLAFSIVRGRFWGREAVNQLAALPIIVPTIVYSIAVYGLFSQLKLIGLWQSIVLA